MDTNRFKIKLLGQEHQIDANVLAQSLLHTGVLVQEINRALDTGKKIDLKVEAHHKGSFEVSMLLAGIDNIKGLFTKENMAFGIDILGGIVNVIDLARFLKGEKIAEKKQLGGGKIEIKKRDGNTYIFNDSVVNIYEGSPKIRDAIAQNFDMLNETPSVEGFELLNNNNESILNVDKKDFADLSLKSSIVEDNERVIIEAATLNIVRAAFEENLRWDFIYKGNKISAKIADNTFQKRIDDGEPFAKGDILKVDLQITQFFDNSVNTYLNKSYQVKVIQEHIKKQQVAKGLEF